MRYREASKDSIYYKLVSRIVPRGVKPNYHLGEIYLTVAILLLAGIGSAHTVTMNFAVVIDGNNTMRVNDTFYNNSPRNASFTSLEKKYISVNETETMAGLVSTGSFAGAYIDTNKTRNIANSSTLMLLHLDNSTKDSGPYGNNMTGFTLANCSLAVPGKFNTACDFGGSFSLPKRVISGTGDYTIAMWIKTTGTGTMGMLSQDDSFLNNNMLSLNLVDGHASFYTYAGGAAQVDDDLIINDGQWHHVAVTKSGSVGKIYVDGQFRKNGTVASVGSAADVTQIGVSSSSDSFTGLIDEIFASNQALSAGQIHDIYSMQERYNLMQMKQTSGRFIIAVTNGTYADIEDKLNMTEALGTVTTTFGRFFSVTPAVFKIFFRLEYRDIDIGNRLEWSGIGSLLIRNTGFNERGVPKVVLELIR